jgi:hypothetical protein
VDIADLQHMRLTARSLLSPVKFTMACQEAGIFIQEQLGRDKVQPIAEFHFLIGSTPPPCVTKKSFDVNCDLRLCMGVADD